MFVLGCVLGLWVLFASPGLTQAIEPEKIPKSIQVDFNPDNSRSDARTPKSYHWPISKGPSSTFVLGAINAEIRSETFGKIGSGLDWGWWKGGYDYGATFSSDGATTQDPADELILELQGLSPGKHSVATWHNDWSDYSNPQAIEIELQVGSSKPSISKQVVPSRRVTHDDDCTTAFFDFEIRAEESAILRVRSKTLGRCAVLNGFAIDVLDPASCVLSQVRLTVMSIRWNALSCDGAILPTTISKQNSFTFIWEIVWNLFCMRSLGPWNIWV